MKEDKKFLKRIKIFSLLVGLVILLTSEYDLLRSFMLAIIISGLSFFSLVLAFTKKGEPKEEKNYWHQNLPEEYQS